MVDASQGVEAQTLANAYLAINHGLEIIPVINKIDLPSADIARTQEMIEQAVGLDATDAIPLKQLRNADLAEVHRFRRRGRHCPKIENPTGSKIVAEPEHLGIIPPELTIQAIAEPYPFLLELFGRP